ncbi:MAG: ABC transporter substrate-binding protein [Candidatus Tectomicrobia bacterium]|uniref:ABC transporter substrate-binding protein n=1 Tax=Tectimicrobiota bacterium TaxID=2528274 RepID=A0A932M0F1_UNCTE|nr:ABC transporter substrate-binding protein [Candidatus Tectomicrobia bacterium]
MRGISTLTLLLFLSGSLLASPDPASAQSSLIKTRLAIPVTGLSQLPIFVARDKKTFQGEGLDVEIIEMRAALAIPALTGSQIDFTTTAETTIRRAVSGLPLKALGFIAIRPALVLMSRPGINSVADLKGGTIAVTSLRATVDFVARDVARHFGLNPDKDITSIALGSDANKLAAVKSGAADAAIITLPGDTLGEEMGLKKLAAAWDYVEGLQSGLATSDKVIKEERDKVVRMTRAFVKSLALARQDRENTVPLIMKLYKLNRKVAESSLDQMIKTFSPDGEAPEHLVRKLIEEVRQEQKMEKEVPLSQVVDFSFVRQARGQ